MASPVKKNPEKVEEKTLVAVPTAGELAVAEQAANQDVLASDVLIPRLLLGQGLSTAVKERKVQMGDFYRSTTREKLGDIDNPVEIVPIAMVNGWMHFEMVSTGPASSAKATFRGVEARNAANEHLPWDYKGPNDQPWIRRKTITLYALVPADVAKYEAELKRAIAAGDAPDLERTVLPVVITFQSSSFKHGGKKCASFFTNVKANAKRMPGLAPYAYTLTLAAKSEQNNKGDFFVLDLGPPKALKDPAVKEEAAKWSQILSLGKVRTDDSEMVDEGRDSSTVAEMEV